MGKKQFIDKKKSVTFNLVYRSNANSDARPDGVLVDSDKGVRVGRVDPEAIGDASAESRYPPGHPLSWLVEEDGPTGEELPEERRRELVSLGFPDDGYDYLAHLRSLGRGAASLEIDGAPGTAAAAPATPAIDEMRATGPSVYVMAPEPLAPEVDVRLYDASALCVLQPAEADADVAEAMGGVTAFSHERQRVHRAERDELAEVERLLEQAEQESAAGSGSDEEGLAGLEDDFVLEATRGTGEEEERALPRYSVAGGPHVDEDGGGGDGVSEDGSGSSWDGSGSGGGSDRGADSAREPARPGSIASTYWRAERRDRREGLAAIDERFEQLALDYDDDEIGSLDGAEPDELAGTADLAQYGAELDEFLSAHSVSQAAHEDNIPYSAPRASGLRAELEAAGMGDEDADVAISKAIEAIRRAEAEPERASAGGVGGEMRQPAWLAERAERDRWDCETILTLTSNLDNHPASIVDDGGRPPRARRPRRVSFDPVLVAQLEEAEQQAQREQQEAERDEEDEAAARRERRASQARPKGETPEEKKARKAAVKDAKRTARATKKDLRSMFTEDAVRASRAAASAQVQAAYKLL